VGAGGGKLRKSDKHIEQNVVRNPKVCLVPGCRNILSKTNKSGYCKEHRERSPHRKSRTRKPYKYRQTTMNAQEQVMLIADSMSTEVQLIMDSNPGLSEDAVVALFEAKMLDMKTSLVSMMRERLKEGMLGSKGLGKVSMFFEYYKMIQDLSKKVPKLMDLAGDILASGEFEPSQSISFEEALRQIIKHEYEVRGL
jgi:hypothetical protein